MANISLKFTNRNGRFCLCTTVNGTCNFLFLLDSHKAIIFNATKLSLVITNQKDIKRPGGG